MRNFLILNRVLLVLFFLLSLNTHAEVIGAGATFPQPVLRAWVESYQKVKPLIVRYDGVGSGEGIRRITARAVDFTLTDIPMTQSELSHDDLMQWPLVISGIVPVVNLPSLGNQTLRLTGEALADIYLGKIKRWDDPQIKALNPTIELPAIAITPIHRDDSSGTSFTFTSYLSRASSAWDEQLGIGSKIVWPAGPGAKGSEGVAKLVQQVSGSIGYVEFLYAPKNQLKTVSLKNKSGNFVEPSLDSFSVAASQANWSNQNYYQILTNLDGTQSWPIVGVSYVLMHKNIADSDIADTKDMLDFFEWIYRNGSSIASAQSYLLINQNEVFSRVLQSWSNVKDLSGKNLYPIK
jgi:phosphate transport system substrate-binding protein